MTVDTEKMKALALAATPGPWRASQDSVFAGPRYRICSHVTAGGSSKGMIDEREWQLANAAHIAAANPAAVLELIAEVERLRAAVETRDALLRDLNAVAIERGDKFGACDCIDNMGDPYPSWHLADVLAASAPASGAKEKP